MLMEWECLVPLKHAGHRHDGNKYPCSHEGEAVAHADGMPLAHSATAVSLLAFYLHAKRFFNFTCASGTDCMCMTFSSATVTWSSSGDAPEVRGGDRCGCVCQLVGKGHELRQIRKIRGRTPVTSCSSHRAASRRSPGCSVQVPEPGTRASPVPNSAASRKLPQARL